MWAGIIHSSLTCRVSSVLEWVASSLVPLRGSAPIFCPWAYSRMTSVFVGGVTSGRGNGRMVGGATEGRPGKGFNDTKMRFQLWLVAPSTSGKILTCRFDNIMGSGTRNLPPILVHTPAISGLPITLDWTKKEYESKLVAWFEQELTFCFCVCLLLTWIVHLVHTEARTVVALVFHHSAQSNWPSIAHTHSQGAGSEQQELKGTLIKQTEHYYYL